MARFLSLSFIVLLFCGCASQEQRSSAPEKQTVSVPKTVLSDKKTVKNNSTKNSSTEKKKDIPSRRSVSGTFCGDKDVSDDF